MICFEDWFERIALPQLKRLQGKKVLIGDNLSSHLSANIVQQCEDLEIAFCFLPANATHLVQPLDVAFFRPLKMAWRNILEKWKKGPGRKQANIPKDTFPQLLKELTNHITTNAASNLIAGFKKSGIISLNRNKVLERIPSSSINEDNIPENAAAKGIDDVDASFLDILNEMRYGNDDEEKARKKRKRKIDVAPGKSIIGNDFEKNDSSCSNNGDSDSEQRRFDPLNRAESKDDKECSSDDKQENRRKKKRIADVFSTDERDSTCRKSAK